MNINPIKALAKEYVPMRINASPKQRDGLVQQWLKETYNELIANKKLLHKQEIQDYFDKKYPDKNINVLEFSSCGSQIIAQREVIVDEKTKKLCGANLYFKFGYDDEIKLNQMNKIVLLHEISHLYDPFAKPKYASLEKDLSKFVEKTEIERAGNNSENAYFDDINRFEHPIFFPKKFKKRLEKTLCEYNLDFDNKMKIASLKNWAEHIETEINAYKNGIKYGIQGNIFKQAVNKLYYTPQMGGVNLKFKQKQKVVNKMLAEALTEERKINARKIKPNS